MHTDEAVHALKFGKLLEEGIYHYDKEEYHGPTLNYLTLIPSWFLSQQKLEEVSEFTLRMIPAIFGTCLILLLHLLKSYLHKKTLILSAILLTVSPALVFYSRYYIQEILLVFFTCGFIFSLIRLLESRKTLWAIVSGIFLGMMHASKETWIISVTVMILAAIILLWIGRKKLAISSYLNRKDIKNIGWLILTAILVSSLFYSSFFSNPQGVIDSLTAFSNYINKAGESGIHLHPWYFYIELLSFNHGPGIIWTEVFLLLAGMIGFIFGVKRSYSSEGKIFLFIGIYSVLLAAVYSLLPYKTPWNLLQFYFGWVILAGYGISMVLQLLRSQKMKTTVYIIIIAGIIHLVFQTYFLNFKYEADLSNPYVYGHTSRDIFRLVEKVNKVLEVQPSPGNIHLEIISANHDYWPLPWYFREYQHTGWWDHVDMNITAAPIIIATPEFEVQILKKLYEKPPAGERYLFIPLLGEPVELRPGVYLEGYVKKQIWDVYVRQTDGEE
jgi:uncharacterized protein (TIGR03663 family)